MPEKFSSFAGFNPKKSLPVIIGLAIYSIWLFLYVGFRIDHFCFIAFFIVMYLSHPFSRKIIMSFIFFLLFWVIYDSMRVYPNYMFNDVHILEPYNLEKLLFSIKSEGSLIIPNEYFASNTNPFFDIITGIFYLTWVPLPIAYGFYLFFNDRRMLLKFSFTFLLTNIIGFVLYYTYPAAPPWYFINNGIIENFDIPGNAANLMRFDAMIGSPLFENMYNKNANVFAAIPSLHAAYPIILFYFGLKKKYFLLSIVFFIDIIGIWFAAVYSLHHYIIDLILGGMCALFAIFVFEFLNKRKNFGVFVEKYIEFTD